MIASLVIALAGFALALLASVYLAASLVIDDTDDDPALWSRQAGGWPGAIAHVRARPAQDARAHRGRHRFFRDWRHTRRSCRR